MLINNYDAVTVVSTGSAATTAGTTAEGTAVPDSSSPNPGMTEDTSTTRRTDAKPTGTMMDMTSITMTTDNSTGMLNSTETDYNGTTVNSSDVPQPPDSGQVR